MCGITGHFSSGRIVDEHGRLSAALDSMRHRGPDDEGRFIDPAGRLVMGMRRLSIQDPSNGKQPVFTENQKVTAIFNGEIYNYKELQAGLMSRGHVLASNSDSEVIVHLYEELGIDFLKELNGMFAIALWDSERDLFLLARDPMGIKPLFYTLRDHGATRELCFGSEVTALEHMDPSRRKIDVQALKTYLTLGYVIPPRTLQHGMSALRPGEALIVERGAPRFVMFHEVPEETSEITTMKEAVEAVDETLKSVIMRQLRSDVPLGIFLSGGIDSGLVAAYSHLIDPSPRPAFFLGFAEKSFDEERLARMSADKFGLEFVKVELKPEEIDWNHVLRINDQPNMNFSIVNTYVIAKKARETVKTILCGDGGDELFGGYQSYQANLWAAGFDRVTPSGVWPLAAAAAKLLPTSYNRMSFEFFLRSFIRGMRERDSSVRHLSWRRQFSNDEIMRIIPFAREKHSGEVLRDEVGQLDEFRRMAKKGDVHQFLYLDHKSYLEGEILTKGDRATMAASLEGRVPLLDLDLLRVSRRIRGDLIVDRSRTKKILREIAALRLPAEVVNAPKAGFVAPVALWMKEGKIAPCERIFTREALERVGIASEPVLAWWNEHRDGRMNHSRRLWTVLSLVDWATRKNYHLSDCI